MHKTETSFAENRFSRSPGILACYAQYCETQPQSSKHGVVAYRTVIIKAIIDKDEQCRNHYDMIKMMHYNMSEMAQCGTVQYNVMQYSMLHWCKVQHRII